MPTRSDPPGGELIRRWFAAALRAVDPEQAVTDRLKRSGSELNVDKRFIAAEGRVFVAAIGKAALPMARGVDHVAADLITNGIAITKDGHAEGETPNWLTVYEAAHPIPDERGRQATERLLESLAKFGEGDLVLALISGGGSALLEAPVDGVTLAEIAATTDLLLRAGAPIHDLNAVRTPLSKVKGGGLRRAATGATFVTLLLSDVLGNDPRVIASGPTVPTNFTAPGALLVLDRFGVLERVPVAVRTALENERTSSRVRFSGDVLEFVADNFAAQVALWGAAQSGGYQSPMPSGSESGEARELAAEFVRIVERDARYRRVVVSGGEATVRVRGDGLGGRNTEFALAAALELERRGLTGWTVASLATDGQDALTGVAGAMADSQTPAKARAAGVDPEVALANNDSLPVFRAVGGVVETGPTGTNVNDIYVAVRTG